MFDTILIPTDGSDSAGTAAEAAIALAERFDATLHVIHVLERGTLPPEVDSDDDLRQHGERTTARIADRVGDDGVETTTAVVDTTAPIHEAIVDYAEEHAVDLIVMGTHGRTGVERFVIGSVTERTVRISPVPVLTVHEAADVDGDFGSILLPTDGSAGARAATDYAVELADASDAALHAVHVVDLTGLWGDFDSTAILDALEQSGQRAVDDVIERAEAGGLRSVEGSVLSGIPPRAIVDYADDRAVDLIVMGTRGRTGLDRYLLGSVTERVVRLSDVPVLTVSMHSDGEN